MTALLAEVVELLYGEAEPAPGFDGDEAAAEVEAILYFSGRPYCLVRDWTIIEVEVSNDYRASLAADGLAPNVLYASDVVLHSSGKRQPGHWMRSTFQRSLIGYFFETKNTVYMLMGPGRRKRGSGQAVMAITS